MFTEEDDEEEGRLTTFNGSELLKGALTPVLLSQAP